MILVKVLAKYYQPNKAVNSSKQEQSLLFKKAEVGMVIKSEAEIKNEQEPEYKC